MEIAPNNRFLALAWGGKNLFLTGMAGTGKSTLLGHFIRGCREPVLESGQWPDGTWKPSPPAGCSIVPQITAPTGIAALNVGGRTVHRFSGILLGPKEGQSNEAYYQWLVAQPFRTIRQGFERIRRCQCLVIDEISMLTGRTFSFLEWLYRKKRGDERPWGGCQVIVIGDFLQLAPVRTRDDQAYDWCFLNEAWERSGFTPIILDKVYRQDNGDFITALTGVREGEVTGDCATLLHERVVQFPSADIPRLFTHNTMVDRWNKLMLEELPSQEHLYLGERKGWESSSEWLVKNLICPEELWLKEGARVMTTINHKDGDYVNGTIGIVTAMRPDWVELDVEGRRVVVERFTWRSGEDEYEGTFTQFPLRLAYAMTIHKSQGLTLDNAYVDIRAAREPGQAYVALSRVRTLEGLHLKDWFRGMYVSAAALKFYQTLEACPYVSEQSRTSGTTPGPGSVSGALRAGQQGATLPVQPASEGSLLLPGLEDIVCGGSQPRCGVGE